MGTEGEAQIGIIGGSRAHNDLLASYLARETGLVCRCELSPGSFRQRDCPACRAVFLLDCLNLSYEAVIDSVAAIAGELSASESLALFNLASTLMIEQDALKAGAKGFFYEGDSSQTIAHGVTAILAGDCWVSRKILVDCFRHETPEGHAVICREPSLSRRENQVLALLVDGLSNKAIADRLCISLPTVKTHVSKIFKKIHLSSRLDAILRADRRRPH